MVEFINACQARAARAMLTWSVRQLALKSKISDSSIRRIEIGFGVPENVTIDLRVKLQTYFETHGFRFTWSDMMGHGVHWRRAVRERRGGERRRA